MKGISIFFKIIIIIFAVEIMVMFLLQFFAISEEPIKSLLDGIFLAFFSSPFLYYFIIKPISEQSAEQIKKIEKKSKSLQLSEKRLEEERNIFISGPVVVFKWEEIAKRPISYVSQNVKDVFGYSVEEITSGTVKFSDIIYAEDLMMYVEAYNEAIDAKSSYLEQEYRLKKKDGTLLWVYDVTTIIRDIEGHVTHSHAYITDLTKRKEYENLFHSLFENATEGIWVMNTDWTTRNMNKHMEEFLALAPSIAVGRSIFDNFAYKDEIEVFQEKVGNFPKGFDCELTLCNENGEKISCLFNTAPLRDFAGNRTGTFAFITDLTEQNKIKKTLMSSEEKFRKMFASHSAMMFLINPAKDGLIVDANSAASKFYGYSIDKLKAMTTQDLNTLPPKRLKIEMQRAVDKKRNVFSFKHRLFDGSIRDVEVHSSAVELKGETLLFSIVHDVTERMKFENELREKREELEVLNRNLEKNVLEEVNKRRNSEQILIQQTKLAAMGEMIGAIAHQWRQPLNALGLLVQDVQDAYDFNELDDVYIADMVRKSMTQVDYMSKTIDDFRNFFREDKDKQVFHVHKSINDILSLIIAQIESNNIRIKFECDEDLKELTLFGYKNEFKQVILNLVANARDAVLELFEKGERCKEDYYDIEITMKKEANVLFISVLDDGVGIPEDILGRVYEPYFTTKEEGKGTGIGLYMSRTIIETNMGGKLTGENIEGGGAKFTIALHL